MQDTIYRPHRTAETSVESWKIINREGTRLTEKAKVFEVICEHGPVTSRMLVGITGLERSSICRSVYDLLGEVQPQIKIAYVGPCNTTGKRVQYYAHTSWVTPVKDIKTVIGGSLKQGVLL